MTDEAPEKIIWPQLPKEMHSDLAAECRDAYAKGQPWTKIRPLQKGVDNPPAGSDVDLALCNGSQGNHHIPCREKLVAVQYTTSFGDPVFYCEEHALKQNDWDIVHYRSVYKPKKVPAGWQEEIDKMMAGFEKKRKKKEESEEIDPS